MESNEKKNLPLKDEIEKFAEEAAELTDEQVEQVTGGYTGASCKRDCLGRDVSTCRLQSCWNGYK